MALSVAGAVVKSSEEVTTTTDAKSTVLKIKADGWKCLSVSLFAEVLLEDSERKTKQLVGSSGIVDGSGLQFDLEFPPLLFIDGLKSLPTGSKFADPDDLESTLFSHALPIQSKKAATESSFGLSLPSSGIFTIRHKRPPLDMLTSLAAEYLAWLGGLWLLRSVLMSLLV